MILVMRLLSVAGFEREQEDATGWQFADIVVRVKQYFCGILGHDQVLHFEDDRVLLKCMSCHHESPDWDVGSHVPFDDSRGMPNATC